jgi:hypothetical protein
MFSTWLQEEEDDGEEEKEDDGDGGGGGDDGDGKKQTSNPYAEVAASSGTPTTTTTEAVPAGVTTGASLATAVTVYSVTRLVLTLGRREGGGGAGLAVGAALGAAAAAFFFTGAIYGAAAGAGEAGADSLLFLRRPRQSRESLELDGYIARQEKLAVDLYSALATNKKGEAFLDHHRWIVCLVA